MRALIILVNLGIAVACFWQGGVFDVLGYLAGGIVSLALMANTGRR